MPPEGPPCSAWYLLLVQEAVLVRKGSHMDGAKKAVENAASKLKAETAAASAVLASSLAVSAGPST